MWKHRAPSFSFEKGKDWMGFFDKWTKKATNTAINTATETLSQKLDQYGGIIKIGLTFGVIALGTKKINTHVPSKPQEAATPQYQPYPQQPIVINNYFDRGYNNGQQKGNGYQQRQNGRQHRDLRGNGKPY